jgi:DNA-binding NarL/FixJ family response regulator
MEIVKDIPHIVYYNSESPTSHTCTEKLSNTFQVTWSMPTSWGDLLKELEQGYEYLTIHVDMIYKSLHTTPIEFIEAILTVVRFIPSTIPLKIGIVIKPDTPMSVIRQLQKTGVLGILLDMSYYDYSEVRIGVNAFINNIPYWPKHIIERLPSNLPKKIAEQNIKLTIRQQQILQLIKSRGASNKAIAKSLGISESTVKLHLTNIFKKYGVRNRTQLAVLSPE